MATTIGIIGSGNIGGTLASLLTRHGYEVLLANSRGPESLAEAVARLGPKARAVDVEVAIRDADLVIEAIPFGRVGELPADAFDGKILISASNYYPGRDGEIDLGGASQSEHVAKKVPSAKVVKAFNTIYWEHLRDQGDRSKKPEDRRVIPIAGDDRRAVDRVAEVVESLGFGPLETGTLAETPGLTQPGDLLYNVDVTLAEATRRLKEHRKS